MARLEPKKSLLHMYVGWIIYFHRVQIFIWKIELQMGDRVDKHIFPAYRDRVLEETLKQNFPLS
jgi:hypothetical protein